MRSDAAVRRAADTYQLGLLRVPASGRAGELLGRGTGSSLVFQEYGEYTPGDDIRHIDWAAYGRSDTLMVRLYREEISPRTEILVDASQSMSVVPAKALLALPALPAVPALPAAPQPAILFGQKTDLFGQKQIFLVKITDLFGQNNISFWT